jgi:membrane-associated phospholipid phosphatase
MLLDDWPLGPATSLVLLGAAFAAVLSIIGTLVAANPRRGRRPSQEVAEELARSTRLRRYLRRRFDPGRATGLALIAALLLIFLGAVAFGQIADMVTSRTGLYRFDAAAADWGVAHATHASTEVLHGLTQLGSTAVIVAAAVMLAVASSRVLLGVHWLTDVIAGAALGFAWFAVCSIAFGGTILQFGATAKEARAAAQRQVASHQR